MSRPTPIFPARFYAVLFLVGIGTFFMRVLAAGMSIFHANDEARVSQLLGVGTWTLPLIVVVGLFVLVVAASGALKLGFRDQLFCYLVASVVVTLIVGVDMMLWRKG